MDSSTTGVNGDSHDNSATEFGAAYVFDLPLASCELSLMTTVLR